MSWSSYMLNSTFHPNFFVERELWDALYERIDAVQYLNYGGDYAPTPPAARYLFCAGINPHYDWANRMCSEFDNALKSIIPSFYDPVGKCELTVGKIASKIGGWVDSPKRFETLPTARWVANKVLALDQLRYILSGARCIVTDLSNKGAVGSVVYGDPYTTDLLRQWTAYTDDYCGDGRYPDSFFFRNCYIDRTVGAVNYAPVSDRVVFNWIRTIKMDEFYSTPPSGVVFTWRFLCKKYGSYHVFNFPFVEGYNALQPDSDGFFLRNNLTIPLPEYIPEVTPIPYQDNYACSGFTIVWNKDPGIGTGVLVDFSSSFKYISKED